MLVCPCFAQALLKARRLVRHHSEVAIGQAMPLIVAVTPAVDALRSQTALNALVLLQVCPFWPRLQRTDIACDW